MQKQNKQNRPHRGDWLSRLQDAEIMSAYLRLQSCVDPPCPPKKVLKIGVKIRNQVAEVKMLKLDVRRRGTREQQE